MPIEWHKREQNNILFPQFGSQSLPQAFYVLFEGVVPCTAVFFGVVVGDGFPKHLFCQFDGMLNAVLFARLGILRLHAFAFFGVVEPIVDCSGEVVAVAGGKQTAFVEGELWGSGAVGICNDRYHSGGEGFDT